MPTDAASVGELAAAALQATITGLLALLCVGVWRRSHQPHFGWWAVAFALFVLRTLAIIAFLTTTHRGWLFWHQVVTGWTALALLWAAIVFAHRTPWRPWYWLVLAFPLLWSYVAVIRLDNFTLAAVPAVIFISGATLWTGIVLLRYRKPGTSGTSKLLGWTFLVWGLHHLDYPILRAQGAWLPWGYYLDILFVLAVGAGILLLVNSDLASRLQARTVDLERLSQRMVRQHEEERRRLSLSLHDETAQVFAAVKMQLGIVRERVDPTLGAIVDRVLSLVDDGLRGVRNITNDLRPALLDDLGLQPALRSLVAEFGERRGGSITFEGKDTLPVLSDEAEVALYRAVQEALSNVARHAAGASVCVMLTHSGGCVRLVIEDAGPGFAGESVLSRAAAGGHMGIVGMRERITALGGRVDVRSSEGAGVRLEIDLPVGEDSPA